MYASGNRISGRTAQSLFLQVHKELSQAFYDDHSLTLQSRRTGARWRGCERPFAGRRQKE
mgnify:CR=1 FL=1